jgi:hypothetical protein
MNIAAAAKRLGLLMDARSYTQRTAGGGEAKVNARAFAGRANIIAGLCVVVVRASQRLLRTRLRA